MECAGAEEGYKGRSRVCDYIRGANVAMKDEVRNGYRRTVVTLIIFLQEEPYLKLHFLFYKTRTPVNGKKIIP